METFKTTVGTSTMLMVSGLLLASSTSEAQSVVTKSFLANPTVATDTSKCGLSEDSIRIEYISTGLPAEIAGASGQAYLRFCAQTRVRHRTWFPTRNPADVSAFFGDQRHIGGLGQLRTTNGRTIVSTELATAAIRGVRLSLGTAFSTSDDSLLSETSRTRKGAIDRLLASGGNLAIQAQAPLYRWKADRGDFEVHSLLGARLAIDAPPLGGVYTNVPTSWTAQWETGLLVNTSSNDLQLALAANAQVLGQNGFVTFQPHDTGVQPARSSGTTAYVTIQLSAIVNRGLQVGFEAMPWRGDLLEHAPRNRLLLSVSL